MVKRFDIPSRPSSALIREIAQSSEEPYTLLYTRDTSLSFVHLGLERMVQVARDTGAGMIYADHFDAGSPSPVTDYQPGSLRDDFDFGGVQLYDTAVLREAVAAMDADYKFAGLYDLRLRVSEKAPIVHLAEFVYYETETDRRDSGVKLFDYVNPRNREVQIEMEAVCTAYLKRIGALVSPPWRTPDFTLGDFPVEASVIIPCRNRVRTIADAIRSALGQKADFAFNVIVVDDNSTDGTIDVIKSFLPNDRLIYIAQDAGWHAIGGNWNAALHHPACGRFALQLDSDDVYSGPDTVQRFVDAFHEQQCAMVVGTYCITDFEMNPLPPGVIDHREWTDVNGPNNALRVNGLGAPRGFWTPLVRKIGFPTTKYGEDYAVGLRISREWKIGRIFETLYFCRRWDDNSDASLDVLKVNANNSYKDSLRTVELQARIRKNAGSPVASEL